MILTYPIHQIIPYINWTYFFHAWGLQSRFPAVDPEARQFLEEAYRMLEALDRDFEVKTTFRLCKANADGDNLILDGTLLPLLRQQSVRQTGSQFLCLSDFVRPLSTGVTDTVGIFASSADADMERAYKHDPYKHLLVQTLADRLVEAATEKMHQYVREEAWGYAKGERLPMRKLLTGDFCGIRPAVGYPSLPDQSINLILDDLLDMKQIGITITENGAMSPHASVSGLMLAHPVARHFAVGKIGEDQLQDYARRRGMSVEMMRKFLAGNL